MSWALMNGSIVFLAPTDATKNGSSSTPTRASHWLMPYSETATLKRPYAIRSTRRRLRGAACVAVCHRSPNRMWPAAPLPAITRRAKMSLVGDSAAPPRRQPLPRAAAATPPRRRHAPVSTRSGSARSPLDGDEGITGGRGSPRARHPVLRRVGDSHASIAATRRTYESPPPDKSPAVGR